MLRTMNFACCSCSTQSRVMGKFALRFRLGELGPHQYMTGIVRNRGSQPVNVCFETEEQHREDRQARPFPVFRRMPPQGQCMTVLTTPGKGSGYAQVIKPGENFAFPFTAPETGQYRLVLQYW